MRYDKDRLIATHLHPALLLCFFALALIAVGCAKHEQMLVERTPAYQPSPPAPQLKMPVTHSPKLPEVQEAVTRVFRDAAVIDSNYMPSFLTGDFNGDSSEDIAVVLKTAPGKLPQMNEEYPAWLLRDPFVSNEPVRSSLHVEEHDVMLAIIHGYGSNDWRDDQATQTYLLKNAVGSGMELRTAKDFLNAHSGRRLPRPQGDLIGEVVRGTPGFLYYASATYAWYDPKTFKGRREGEQRMVHSSRPMSR
jgi:hypothetical protein